MHAPHVRLQRRSVRLATWNVNSIRSRADRVAAWLERSDVDVVALQETKCRDDQFPEMMFNAIGYEVAHVGHSQWNGVAILSRVGLDDVEIGFPGMPSWSAKEGVDPPPRRARSAPPAAASGCGACTCPTAARWPTRTCSTSSSGWPRCATRPAGWLADDPAAPIALVGDWNIAPENDDVWDMAVFAHSTHVSPPERAAFRAVVDAGYADVVRPYAPGPGVYTYWDYTQLRFPRREGMRIDFVLGSPALAARVDRRADRPRGAQGQGRQRPRPGDRRPGGLKGWPRRVRRGATMAFGSSTYFRAAPWSNSLVAARRVVERDDRGVDVLRDLHPVVQDRHHQLPVVLHHRALTGVEGVRLGPAEPQPDRQRAELRRLVARPRGRRCT